MRQLNVFSDTNRPRFETFHLVDRNAMGLDGVFLDGDAEVEFVHYQTRIRPASNNVFLSLIHQLLTILLIKLMAVTSSAV